MARCSNANDNLVYNLVFHELGHNFGLGHGGVDFENYKPNYVSTMNYYWGDNGLGIDTNCDGIGDGVLGFSSGEKPDLNENALIEANGICGPGPGHAIDWNGNGVIDPGPIAFNINPQNGPELTIMKDSNDIALMSFAGLNDAD